MRQRKHRSTTRNLFAPAAVVLILACSVSGALASQPLPGGAGPAPGIADLPEPGSKAGPPRPTQLGRGFGPSWAQAPARKKASYAPGELIVKYRSSVTESVYELVNTGRPFRLATIDRSSSLDRLHERYGVRSARPLFRTLREEARIEGANTSDALRSYHAARTRRVERRFGERTQRAPDDARLPDLSQVYVLEVPEGTDVEAAARAFEGDPHVAYAQPNYRLEVQSLPNDTYVDPDQNGSWSSGAWGQPYEDLWGLRKIRADQAWPVSEGEGTVVAVVDTGLDLDHPDIQGNIWENPGESGAGRETNGVDDDANGFADDARGWDFAYDDNDPTDGYGHGTHVSGTIAAVGNNDQGIVGVAPEAKIMPVKGLGDVGQGEISWLAGALHYAADNGADVINNSWGCNPFGMDCSSIPALEDAVAYAHAVGALPVFAAGNLNTNVNNYSPQNQPEALVVSAFNQNDEKAFFSNWGTKVDVAAPGGGVEEDYSNVLSLLASPSYLETVSPWYVVASDYMRLAGTSMAAPHVSGLAALILTQHGGYTNEQVRQVLRSSADDVDAPGFDPNSGYGLINAARALGVDVLDVRFSEPLRATDLSGLDELEVRGTAAGAGFQSYELSYGAGILPSEWVQIASSSSPVEDGLLGTWDVGSLGTDYYMLRLRAVDAQGFTHDRYVQVFREQGQLSAVTDQQYINQLSPAVSGDKVVWADVRSFVGYDIYLRNLSTGAERRLTTASANERYPAIWGDKVVWEDNRNGNADIYLYNLLTNTERRLTTDPGEQTSPDVSGDRVVWLDRGGDEPGIHVYDMVTRTERLIPAAESPQNPAIWGDEVVWEDYRNAATFDECVQDPASCALLGNWDIYLYDLATDTERQITSDPRPQSVPDVSGDTVVWSDPRDDNWEVYSYDLSTDSERRITSDTATQWQPRISVDRIVWSDFANSNWDVTLYDLDADAGQLLTSEFGAQFAPAISCDRVAWEEYRNDPSSDIYASESPNVDCPPVLRVLDPDVNDDGTVTGGDIAKVVAAFGTTDRAYDVNGDGSVSGGDISLIVTAYGWSWPPANARKGKLLHFFVVAQDPDGDSLDFAAQDLPAGATFTNPDGATANRRREFRWTPSQSQAGSYQVTFSASDGSHASNKSRLPITVLDAP